MTTIPRSAPARFTGWHMLAILAAFFGVVIAVNLLLARLATATFSGEVVANSYVASQDFNHWLAEARAEAALGWHADPVLDHGALTVRLTDASGRPLTGAAVTADLRHPLGDAAERAIRLSETAPGLYAAPLDAGRWQMRLTVLAGGHRWHHAGELAPRP